jgi:hypothetical protein
MAKQLSKQDIVTRKVVKPGHVSQSVDAFTGIEAYDITISGSLTLTGSLAINGLSTSSQTNILTIDSTTGQLYYTASSAIGGGGGFSNTGSFTGSFTGSLQGTASYANNALSASYAATASYVNLVAGPNITINQVGTAFQISGSGGGGGGYTTVENEGTPLTQRSTINFVGAGVTATDDGSGKTIVTITGASGSLAAAGNNYEIQFNSGSELAATSSFRFNYLSESLEQGSQVIASGLWSHAQGTGSIALGIGSHAEGWGSQALGTGSHAEGLGTIARGDADLGPGLGGFSHAEGGATIASGSFSHAEGIQTLAEGIADHAEGFNTTASSIGWPTNAVPAGAHAEGYSTRAYGIAAHAEGIVTIVSGSGGHAEGYGTIAFGLSHAEGFQTTASYFQSGSFIITDGASHSEGFQTFASGGASHAEGRQTVSKGRHSHAEGSSSLSLGISSHAEGFLSTSSGNFSHAEGVASQAIGQGSHAEGFVTISSGSSSHAQGFGSISIGDASFASGYYATASSDYSIALGGFSFTTQTNGLFSIGVGTKADNSVFTAMGKYNATGSDGNYGIFVVGGGGSDSSRGNLFRVSGSGQCLSAATFTNGGADYAEYFESYNGQSIPVGTVVELTGSYIKICETAENAIGVISNKPSILGNSDEGTSDEWVGKYETDIWGNYVIEEYEYEMPGPLNENLEPTFIKMTGTRKKLNPNFDPTLPYTPRSERPEWNVVGLLGQIKVLKNQNIPSRWIKMKDISDEIALYLVK